MAERIRDRYPSERDRASLAAEPAFHRPPGTHPVLQMTDFNRRAFGDR